MCLILLAYRLLPESPVVMLSNRDEYYQRPSRTAHFWEDTPQVFGGRDHKEGGTWLGVTLSGRWAALTNYRDPAHERPGRASRGWLVQNFLQGTLSPADYLAQVHTEAERYNSFNLLVGDENTLGYYSNREGLVRWLEPGLYGLSNALLDDPWPKVQRGKAGLHKALYSGTPLSVDECWELLAETSPFPDENLPQTGVGLEVERWLSPLCIITPIYGTRTSTILLRDAQNHWNFYEKTYEPLFQQWTQQHYFLSYQK